MAVSTEYARTLMGQWVDCHTVHGMYSGVLREVRPDGIVMEAPGGAGGAGSYVDGYKKLKVEHADEPDVQEYTNVFRPFFNPFRFFIPFFLLLALSRRRFI